MIVHAIKTVQPTFTQQVVQHVQTALVPYRYASANPNRMGKLQYGIWLEEVRKDWDVGEFVTIKGLAEVPNVAPFHYRITGIDEIWYNVPYDTRTNEPLAIVCRTPQGIYMNKGPSTIRHLTAQEIACVNLSNIKTIGNA